MARSPRTRGGSRVGAPAPFTTRRNVAFRIPASVYERIEADAKRQGWSVNEMVLSILTDAYAWAGVPRAVAEDLEQDRERLGYAQRDYVQRALVERWQRLHARRDGARLKR